MRLINNLDYIIPRTRWYRMKEREKERTKLNPRIKVGDKVKFERCIIRTGYEYEHRDCPYDVQNQIAKTLLINRFNVKITNKREKFNQLTSEMVELILSILNTDNSRVLRHLLYEARGIWLSEQVQEKIRTFWYVNSINYLGVLDSGIVLGVQPKWIGVPYSSVEERTLTPEGEEYEIIPGGLENRVYQQVYLVDSYYRGRILVHPLDVIPMGENE